MIAYGDSRQIMAGVEVALTTQANEVTWTITDHLGSVTRLLGYDEDTQTTTIEAQTEYDAFGNPTAVLDFLFGYTGRAHDKSTDLNYNWNRWYDSLLAKWLSDDPIGFAAGDPNLSRYVGNSPTHYIDPTGLVKGRIVGWVVRRVGGKLVKVSALYTHKQAAEAFAGRCGRYGLDLLMREGRHNAEKVARIIQARLGKDRTGEVLGGGSHLGHPIRNLLGQSIGTGRRHIQLDRIANRHIFYGALAAALGLYATEDAVAGDYSLDLTEVYGDPMPGESFANVLRVGWWCGEDSMAAYLDWVNPGDLIAMGGDFGRHLEREWTKELIGYIITILDENGQPLLTAAIGPDGEPISQTPWDDGEAGVPIRYEVAKWRMHSLRA